MPGDLLIEGYMLYISHNKSVWTVALFTAPIKNVHRREVQLRYLEGRLTAAQPTEKRPSEVQHLFRNYILHKVDMVPLITVAASQ